MSEIACETRHGWGRQAGKDGGGGKGALFSCLAIVVSYERRPSHTYNADTERIGFTPTRQTSRDPREKRLDVFGEPHEGRAALR